MKRKFFTFVIIIQCLFTLQTQNAVGQSTSQNSIFLEELTWTEVRDFIEDGGTTIIIPTGGTEQNGPHMVLGKHNYRVKYMAEKIAHELGNALVAPIIAYVPEGNIDPAEDWMLYTGTISLPEGYFIKLVEYTCRSLKQHGFIDIVLIGDSGENQNGLKIAAETLNAEWGSTNTRVHFLSDYYGKPFVHLNDSLVASGISQEALGYHGGVVDVSFLLAIDSNMIRTSKLDYGEMPVDEKFKLGFSGDPLQAKVEYGEFMIRKTLEMSLAQLEFLKVENRK